MSDRRFSEAEAAAILEAAAERHEVVSLRPTTAGGLTLQQLQDVGRQAGIDPAHIAAAATRSNDRATTRRVIGLPIGVQHVVRLPRDLTTAEWEQLVVDLRETFDAKGKVTTDGSLRQWSNGNLHVFVEKDREGHRLRMRTFKSDALPLLGGGAGFFGAAAAMVASMVARGRPAAAVAVVGVIAAGALIAAVGMAVRLFGWSRQRREQMQAVADRTLSALSET